tara:strand:+ start:301 stop:462 length:162 start_codon:yes stop_codon:yes gene_type:complete
MKKYLIIILIFLVSCTKSQVKNNVDFDINMNFDEFIIKLDEYAKKKSYPNINN